MKTLFEKSVSGRSGLSLTDIQAECPIPDKFLRDDLLMPELSEVQVVRHFMELSRRNFGVDSGFYPLGSCTMKYNPKVNEDIARIGGFDIHPDAPADSCQGNLELLYEMERLLCEIIGMDAFTLQPAAGAHGELTSVMIAKKYYELKGEKRDIIFIPDSAHGTNPASASHCGFTTKEISSDADGNVDIEKLKEVMDSNVAILMLTYPNTLGLFDSNIKEIIEIVHDKGGLVYMDGANMNAMLGTVRPGDLGVDLLHLNLHKSFSTPHGGGGPGSGPVGVKKELERFLPNPRIRKNDKYEFFESEDSIGKVKAYYGNFGVVIKAYSYIKSLGYAGLKRVSENAVLNANYLKERLKKTFELPYDRRCGHEFVLSDKNVPNGITTANIAKRLLDYGIHAPTIYFPLIVHGALMIEPTETEGKEVLDKFCDVMEKIYEEAKTDPDKVKNAPHNLFIGLLDNVKAARELDLKWE